MLRLLRKSARLGLVAGLLFGLFGCGRGTPEDRTIEFSPEGESIAFQHGREGIFVWNAERGQVEKIYHPSDEVIANGTPLWSPDGSRLVFTTAILVEGNSTPTPENVARFQIQSWDANPEGRRFGKIPAVYTCWLCQRATDGRIGEPEKLFEAHVNHVGMVAANLSVRWHPNGERLLYAKASKNNSHHVFEWDLEDSTSRAAAPFVAENLLFDWSPGGDALVCVVQDSKNPDQNGIWMGLPAEVEWWQVPDSGKTLGGAEQDKLPLLRRLRPVWSRDGERFAFVAGGMGKGNQSAMVLFAGEYAKRSVREVYRVKGSIRDVHWSPDGNRLGYLLGTKELKELRGGGFPLNASDLLMIQSLGEPEPVPSSLRPIRHFAGWNFDGTSMAYAVPSSFNQKAKLPWAFLLSPRHGPRDRAYVVDPEGQSPDREVFSGMRATFLNWSPTKNQLSMWATFEPTHALLPFSLPGNSVGLRPGDPAAILDIATGQINWMPVNAREKVQIGHYHLIQKNYAEARRWYDEASKELAEQDNKAEAENDPLGPERFELFHSYCLEKLGEDDSAQKKLREFFKLTSQPSSNAKSANAEDSAAALSIIRQLYIAQVFLSLGAADDGLKFFDEQPESLPKWLPKKTLPGELFALKLAHAQMLLNAEKWDDFADLAGKDILPLILTKDLKSCDARSPGAITSKEPAITAAGFCLLPLMAEDFVNRLSKETLADSIPDWTRSIEQANSEVARLWIDRFLHLASKRLGDENQAQAARARYDANPQKPKYDFDAMFDPERLNLRQQLQILDLINRSAR